MHIFFRDCIKRRIMASRTLPTRNITQNQLFERNFQNYIKKLHSNYKTLLVKHAELLQQSSLIGNHEELQIEAATDSIVSDFFEYYVDISTYFSIDINFSIFFVESSFIDERKNELVLGGICLLHVR